MSITGAYARGEHKLVKPDRDEGGGASPVTPLRGRVGQHLQGRHRRPLVQSSAGRSRHAPGLREIHAKRGGLLLSIWRNGAVRPRGVWSPDTPPANRGSAVRGRDRHRCDQMLRPCGRIAGAADRPPGRRPRAPCCRAAARARAGLAIMPGRPPSSSGALPAPRPRQPADEVGDHGCEVAHAEPVGDRPDLHRRMSDLSQRRRWRGHRCLQARKRHIAADGVQAQPQPGRADP